MGWEIYIGPVCENPHMDCRADNNIKPMLSVPDFDYCGYV